MMHRKGSNEEGSALVMALVFITVVSILIGAVLTFADVSLRYTRVVEANRGKLYAADGGVESAIAEAKATESCRTFTSPEDINGVKPKVTCEPSSEPPPGSESPTRPSRAILAYGDSSAEGLINDSGGPVRIKGDVFSNSKVSVASPGQGIDVAGEVGAVLPCTTMITPACTVSSAVGLPLYPLNFEPLQPVHREIDTDPMTSDVCTDQVVELAPGYYDDAEALTKLTKVGDGFCDSISVVWFKPGDYYFDFNYASSSPCVGDDVRCKWVVQSPDIAVIGGDPKGWNPLTTGTPIFSSPNDRCKTESDAGSSTGVQFVMGGDSSIEFVQGDIELCAKPSGNAQQIALYGVTPDTEGTPPSSSAVTLEPEQATDNPTGSFDGLEDGKAIGGFAASFDPGTTDETASMVLESFTPAIDPGSKIGTATVQVVHSETDPAQFTRNVKVTLGATVLADETVVPCAAGANVFCLFTMELPSTTTWATLRDMKAEYTVTSSSGDSFASLDGIEVDVTGVTPPYFRTLSETQPILRTSGVAGSKSLAIRGTVYAPTTAIDLTLTGVSRPVVNRGVIVRTARLNLTPDDPGGPNEYTGPMISLPDTTTRQAILTLGDDSDNDGFRQVDGSGRLVVRGDVISKTDVVANDSPDPSLLVRGDVVAGETCSGSIATQSGSPSPCLENTDLAEDPGFAVPALPQANPPPSVTCLGSGVAQLGPGLYTDLIMLNGLAGSCSRKIVHFSPGIYYFNFDFDGGCAAPADCAWIINDPLMRIVGGQEQGWSPATLPADKEPPFPAACLAGGPTGVEFVFGGQSQLDVQAGQVELCAGSSNSSPTALYGLKSSQPSQTLNAQLSTPTGFTDQGNALAIGGGSASASPSSGSPASLALSQFDVSSIPADARIDTMDIIIVHDEVDTDFTLNVTADAGEPLSLDSSDLTPCTVPATCGRATVPVNLAGAPLAGDDLASLSITYTVGRTGTAGTALLDGIEVDVTYTSLGGDGLRGCHEKPYDFTDNPTDPSSSCAVLKASGSNTRLAVQGVLYAPTGAVDLELSGVDTPVLGQGIVSRMLRMGVTPDPCYAEGPVIAAFEDPGPGAEPGMVFTACLPPDNQPRIRARVTFPDAEPPKIESWSVLP